MNNCCYFVVAARTAWRTRHYQRTHEGATSMWTTTVEAHVIVVIDNVYNALRIR